MDANKIRILLIGDAAGDIGSARAGLADSWNVGLKLLAAKDMSEGLKILASEKIDLVFLDLEIVRDTDVSAVLGKRFPETPIIVIAESDTSMTLSEALHFGAEDVVIRSEIPGRLFARYIMNMVERRRLERELSEFRIEFNTIFNGVSDGILLADAETKVLRAANSTICRWLGYTRDELMGMSILDIHPKESLPYALEQFDRQSKGEIALAENIPILRKDGRVFFTDVNASAIILSGKKCLLGTFRDITEHREIQARLAQSDRMVSLGMLAAGVVHEINNPLTYVLYNAENLAGNLVKMVDYFNRCSLLIAEKLGEEAVARLMRDLGTTVDPNTFGELVEQANEAVQGAKRIRRIVRDLKSFSHVEEDIRSNVRLNRAIEIAINMAFNEIKYKARLEKEYQDTQPVSANEGRLAQVFLNLLINAAQSIDEGDAERNKIRVRTWTEGDEALAEVTDTGKGIRPEALSRVFDPFFTTKPAGVGSGLGLSICRSIIVSLGGAIEVESKVGQGTRFVVRLPISRGEETPSDTKKSVSAEPPVARSRVLVIDDEKMVAKSIARILKKTCDVSIELSGEEALLALKKDKDFDLILCDVMMPGMSGVDLYDLVSEIDPDLARRMVFVTGGTYTPRAMEFRKRVPNTFIEKTIDASKLVKLVRDLVASAKKA